MAMALTNGRCSNTTRSRCAILAFCFAMLGSALADTRVCSVSLTPIGFTGAVDAVPLRRTVRNLVGAGCGAWRDETLRIGSWNAGATAVAAALAVFSVM